MTVKSNALIWEINPLLFWSGARICLYPRLPGLAALAKQAAARSQDPVDAIAQQQLIAQGNALIEKLKLAEQHWHREDVVRQWKKVMEDLSIKSAGLTEAVWAAIRNDYYGILETPYGVLIGNLEHTLQVLRDHETFSVREYWERMNRSLGQGYLGMDPNPSQIAAHASVSAKALDARYLSQVQPGRYKKESEHPNPLIFKVSEDDAFALAKNITTQWLNTLIQRHQQSGANTDAVIPLRLLLADVFAGLSHTWFGVPENPKPPHGRKAVKGLITVAGYVFYPDPIDLVKQQAQAQGQLLAESTKQYVAQGRADKAKRTGIVSGPLFDVISDDDQLARTVLGIAQGFMAPTSGNFFSVMYTLTKTRQLWRLQQLLSTHSSQQQGDIDTKKLADTILKPALVKFMQYQPSPDQIHRTAIKDVEIGGVPIKAGERVVLGLISATRGQPGSTEILFGGDYGKKDAPVHSCPGQPMAMGALLGMLNAILEVKALQPGPFPLTLSVSKEAF